MKLYRNRKTPLRAGVIAFLIVILATGVALALTLSNVDGVWSNARTYAGVTPSSIEYINTLSTTDENQVRYGTPVTSGGKSGFGFDGNDGDFTIVPGEVFLLGKFTHYNNPIYATNIMNLVDLDVTLNLTDPAIEETFTFTVELDETPNSTPCAYGATNGPCDDRVILPASIPDQTFTIDGVPYTLQITGFIPGDSGACPATPPVGSTPQTDYITAESTNNYACMYAQLVLPVDFGDAPDAAGQTAGVDPGRHNITATGPYLGTIRGDGEINGQPNASATGDDTSAFDDEDGFIAADTNWDDGSGWITVQVNRGTAAGADRACVYAWIDWAGDGFGVGSDSTSQGYVTATGNLQLNFADTPASIPNSLLVRLRVRSNNGACPALGTAGNAPTGLWADGEIEDHLLTFNPLAAELASFTGATSPEGVTLAWETVSETDVAGFNLLRGDTSSGPWAQLNLDLIPAIAPGSAQGSAYTWLDPTAAPGATYFYALEDVGLDGATTRHDPISVTPAGEPNAVSLSAFGAAATAAWPPLAGVAAMAGLAAAGFARRRRGD